jgi:hypothetical protein
LRKAKPMECHRGHALTGENCYRDTRGRRMCRICRAGAQARYEADPGAQVKNVPRFAKWLEAWLKANETSGDRIAKAAGISPRVVYAIRRGERQWLHLDTVDAILCATGEARLLDCFHRPDGKQLRPLPKAALLRRPDRSARCRSGDACSKTWGFGPNGRFCEHHGAELNVVMAQLKPRSRNQTMNVIAARSFAGHVK